MSDKSDGTLAFTIIRRDCPNAGCNGYAGRHRWVDAFFRRSPARTVARCTRKMS